MFLAFGSFEADVSTFAPNTKCICRHTDSWWLADSQKIFGQVGNNSIHMNMNRISC